MIKRLYAVQQKNLFLIKLFLLYVLIFGHQSFFLWSQVSDENQPQQGNPLACFIIVQNISAGPGNESAGAYEELINSSLEINLKKAGFLLLSYDEYLLKNNLPVIAAEELQSSAGFIQLGKQMGANLGFISLFRIAENNLHITLKCYSMEQNRLVGGSMKKSILGLAAHNVIDKSITALVDEVAKNPALLAVEQPADTEKIPVENALINISLLSEDENAEVFINGEENAGTIINGCLNLYTLKNAELLLELRKKGHHSLQTLVKIEETKRSYKLPRLTRETRWGTELYYTAERYLGLGLGQRYYLWPDRGYISLDNYLYYMENVNDFSYDIFNDIRLLAGYYFLSGPEQVIRVGTAAGFGLLLSSIDAEQPLYMDYYMNILNLALEANLRQWIFYLRVELKYTLGIGRNLREQSWFTSWKLFPPVSLGIIRKW